ncbi:hypothetical protein P691DRAFT_166821 [Macrolepiota fuliginosa MF-IS2]|uniref:Calcofluor white hypersensitive protein n=1 Tax=Macrolepiota fuliginosa MF-IS2 TaxID=1400762 RepID=A0A9P5X9U0_9AGAR|nr:hypothetical protein P691DRAFT_166821 [Macrolepiota fuliginosa MF-IS2]
MVASPVQPVILKASTIARTHTVLAYIAFTSALGIGCLLHYKKIVKNGVAGYPQEWFPSVSATIGDWYPERNIFQIIIALTSGPRFALVYLQYYLQTRQASESFWPAFLLVVGVVRTLSCGGWVYITSSDDHDVHDFFMILYMVCNIPWTIGGVLSSRGKSVRRRRTLVASVFFLSIVPLVYFFIQHKVHRIPGAYTKYAFFEWSLIFFDVLYDAISEQEFAEADLKVTVGTVLEGRSSEQLDYPKSINESKKPDIHVDSATAVGETNATERSKQSVWSMISGLVPTSLLSFLSDVYLSYVFLTLFTALIPSLFYFSIWELGIAGQELALLAALSPFFLGFSSVRTFAISRMGQVVLQSLSLTSLLAYLLDKPLQRLMIVTPAVALGSLAVAAKWLDNDGGYQAIVFGLGWIVTSLAKHANHTNNPLWPFINSKSGGYNRTGLVLAILALRQLSTRPITLPKSTTKLHGIQQPHWISAALPLGSLIFSIHTLLAESSTLVAWSWSGYENGAPRGPLPHVHSSLTILVQCLGLALALYSIKDSTSDTTSISQPSGGNAEKGKSGAQWNVVSTPNPIYAFISSPGFYTFGVASAYVLYSYKNWPGYVGGLGVAFFLMCMIPIVFRRVVAATKADGDMPSNVGRTLGTAFVVYCLLTLACIFTVAYAFIPGGVYFRERTDMVLIVQMACFLPLFSLPSRSAIRSTEPSLQVSRTTTSYIYALLSIMSAVSGIVTIYRLPSSPPQPFKPGPRIIQAGIWTVHFGFDNEGHDSQRGIRNLVRDMQLDIVGLLETDLHRTSFGHRDLTRVIVEDMGYNVDIGPGPNQHTWGCVLLSKFPIVNSTHHLLPSPHGELAPAIEAVLNVYGTEVTVVVAHNGQEEDPLDRELQSTELARIMRASYPKPVIFLGYVVTRPYARRPNPYEIMVADGRVHDIDQDDFDRWCEYIFYRGLYRTSYARISRGIITDTEMQIGQFVLPRHGTSVSDESVAARYSRAQKEQLAVDHWFPMEYYGGPGHGGVNGHFYHVFNTPLYYLLPPDATV